MSHPDPNYDPDNSYDEDFDMDIDSDDRTYDYWAGDDDLNNDYMDGNHDSAMTSCGWGTEEDYGLYDDYEDFHSDDGYGYYEE